MLVAKYQESNLQDKTILVSIDKAINSSLQLRSKKELIEKFIEQVTLTTIIDEDWRRFIIQQKDEELDSIIKEENLKEEETKRFMSNAFRDGVLRTTGTDLDKIMPPISRFSGGRTEKKQKVIERLLEFYEKYNGLV